MNTAHDTLTTQAAESLRKLGVEQVDTSGAVADLQGIDKWDGSRWRVEVETPETLESADFARHAEFSAESDTRFIIAVPKGSRPAAESRMDGTDMSYLVWEL